MSKKNTKTVATVKNVTTNEISVDELMENTKIAQKQNSIWAEFGPEPAIVAITGVALQQKAYRDETDIALHLKVVFEDDQDRIRITTIRAFYRKNEKTGQTMPMSVAFRNAISIVTETGIKIQKIHSGNENPNLSTFNGWTELPNPVIVSIETRESNKRFWPNNVTKYNPIQVNVADIVASCGGDVQ